VLQPADLLQHATRLLAPGGVLLVYTPVWCSYDFVTSWLARLTAGAVSRPIDRRINAAHLQIFPYQTLRGLLARQRLTVRHSRRLCEYNLPVHNYLYSMGVGGTIGSLIGRTVSALIGSNLFFRNNQRVLAVKS
jgi:hypothetical protein